MSQSTPANQSPADTSDRPRGSRSNRAALSFSLVALLIAAVGAGPQAAQAVRNVANSDKVDGLHAVKATKKPAKRKNRLVATNRQGRLPNNIIRTAPNAQKLGGQPARAYAKRAEIRQLADATNPATVSFLESAASGTVEGDRTYQQAVELGEFVKLSDSSALRLDLSSNVTTYTGNTGFCQVLLAAHEVGKPAMAPDEFTAGPIHTQPVAGTVTPLTGTQTLTELGAGTYSLGLWVRGSENQTCRINVPGVTTQVTLTEFAVR